MPRLISTTTAAPVLALCRSDSTPDPITHRRIASDSDAANPEHLRSMCAQSLHAAVGNVRAN